MGWLVKLAAAAVLVGFTGAVIWYGITRDSARRAECERLGGHYFRPSAGSICIASEIVIPLKGSK